MSHECHIWALCCAGFTLGSLYPGFPYNWIAWRKIEGFVNQSRELGELSKIHRIVLAQILFWNAISLNQSSKNYARLEPDKGLFCLEGDEKNHLVSHLVTRCLPSRPTHESQTNLILFKYMSQFQSSFNSDLFSADNAFGRWKSRKNKRFIFLFRNYY